MTVSPGGQDDGDPYGHVLASDAEREATVERLRVAAADGRITLDELNDRSEVAYRARTGAELTAITHDLPALQPGTASRPVVRAAADDVTDSYVAVFGGQERKGHWRVPRRSRAVAVFGGVALDLRQAEFAAQEVQLEAKVAFGGIEIKVPPGVEVHMTGMAIFGGKSSNVPPAGPGAPVLHIHCNVWFGGIDVKVEPVAPPPATSLRERFLPRPPSLP